MGTAIVSIGLYLDGVKVVSRVLLAAAGIAWIVAGVLAGLCVWAERTELAHRAAAPGTLALVAGSAVLGTRLVFLGWIAAGAALLSIAVVLSLTLMPLVVAHWRTPTVGVSLMPAVATQSVAILAAELGGRLSAAWLIEVAFAVFLVGLGFYVAAMARFDRHQLLVGRGDHWITGGALAISSLAAGSIAIGAQGLGAPGGLAIALKDVAVALWALTMVWLPVLLVAELARPRLRYTAERWSTVFPVGMYAASAFIVAAVAGSPAIRDFARIWVWIAAATWLAVLAGMSRRVLRSPPDTLHSMNSAQR
jgi:Voltage-dependent anion channel